MKQTLVFALAALLPLATLAQDAPAADMPPAFAPLDAAATTLEEFVWTARPVVVFADTEADPAFAEQIRLLEDGWPMLAERDVVVIVDADPAKPSAIRQRLRPRGFMLVLIGKDGQIALRKPFPWDVRELSRSIDKMPQRREELRNRRSISP